MEPHSNIVFAAPQLLTEVFRVLPPFGNIRGQQIDPDVTAEWLERFWYEGTTNPVSTNSLRDQIQFSGMGTLVAHNLKAGRLMLAKETSSPSVSVCFRTRSYCVCSPSAFTRCSVIRVSQVAEHQSYAAQPLLSHFSTVCFSHIQSRFFFTISSSSMGPREIRIVRGVQNGFHHLDPRRSDRGGRRSRPSSIPRVPNSFAAGCLSSWSLDWKCLMSAESDW